MFNYKVQLKGKKLPQGDEEILITLLKMLDFSAEHLTTIYHTDKIKFCSEAKEIVISDAKKHNTQLDDAANSYGFKLKTQ